MFVLPSVFVHIYLIIIMFARQIHIVIMSTYWINITSFRYQTFVGNTDKNTIVENRLNVTTPVVALCIRLYPVLWFSFPCLRMEVLGCHHNNDTDGDISGEEPRIIFQGILTSIINHIASYHKELCYLLWTTFHHITMLFWRICSIVLMMWLAFNLTSQ